MPHIPGACYCVRNKDLGAESAHCYWGVIASGLFLADRQKRSRYIISPEAPVHMCKSIVASRAMHLCLCQDECKFLLNPLCCLSSVSKCLVRGSPTHLLLFGVCVVGVVFWKSSPKPG